MPESALREPRSGFTNVNQFLMESSALHPTAHPPSTVAGTSSVTRLLGAWRKGDASALQDLTPLVYEELKTLARRYMKRERAGHTLQATAVVHEAFVRLVGMDVPWQDRMHFFAVAARLMRRILVDHAKGRQRNKRGGELSIVSLAPGSEGGQGATNAGEIDVLEIDDALERLSQRDPRLAQIVELHYFAGMTYQETALALGISEATVHRDLRMAKAWILSQIRSPESSL